MEYDKPRVILKTLRAPFTCYPDVCLPEVGTGGASRAIIEHKIDPKPDGQTLFSSDISELIISKSLHNPTYKSADSSY